MQLGDLTEPERESIRLSAFVGKAQRSSGARRGFDPLSG